jgi:hypothetical protein
MAVSVKCTGVSNGAAGQLYINWDDGTQTEYPSVPSAFNSAVDMDSNPDNAKKFLIGNWLRLDPAGVNPQEHIIDRTCMVNCTATDKVKIT